MDFAKMDIKNLDKNFDLNVNKFIEKIRSGDKRINNENIRYFSRGFWVSGLSRGSGAAEKGEQFDG